MATATMALPEVDFNFDELRTRMSRFTLRFDEFIAAGRRRILEEKNSFAQAAAFDAEQKRALCDEITTYRAQEAAVAEGVAKEEAEALEAEGAIAEMERRRKARVEHKDMLLSQIAEVRGLIEKKRAILAEERKVLSSQSNRNGPELAFWEEHLGMRIEGTGVADHLRVVFTYLSDADYAKEFFFVVSMVARDYEIVQCRPKLDKEAMGAVVDRLNDTRDFTAFLKDMRTLFKHHAATA